MRGGRKWGLFSSRWPSFCQRKILPLRIVLMFLQKGVFSSNQYFSHGVNFTLAQHSFGASQKVYLIQTYFFFLLNVHTPFKINHNTSTLHAAAHSESLISESNNLSQGVRLIQWCVITFLRNWPAESHSLEINGHCTYVRVTVMTNELTAERDLTLSNERTEGLSMSNRSCRNTSTKVMCQLLLCPWKEHVCQLVFHGHKLKWYGQRFIR